MQGRASFKKEERLCSKITIDRIFAEGIPLFVFPFRLLYLPLEKSSDSPAKVLFSVPKKKFKSAVQRNLLRRRMREAYRLNKNALLEQLSEQGMALALVIIYTDRKACSYAKIEKQLIKLLALLQDKVEVKKSV
ncbi:ribonuclease P protein component [Roseimarinus sediminis]|uniref:ribonuclease P protein component n=1 Tax=Roseimarinus sediminis TaxID=1610899 RepID=UPI003D1F4305